MKEEISAILELEVKVQSQMLISDCQEGYALGRMVRSRELEALTGVDARQVEQMAKEIVAVINRVGTEWGVES